MSHANGIFSEDESEKMRMKKQAILARWLKETDEERLLGTPKPWFENVPLVAFGTRQPWSVTGPLKQEKQHRVIRLTHVEILLPTVGGGQGGETIAGTLEAHVNGFIYTASGFRKHFYFDDIKYSFFRLGDKRMPPILHFHLHPPLKEGMEMSKDIEFRLLQCPLGQSQKRPKKSGRDSDKFAKEKQSRWDNKRLKKFVDKVNARWLTLPVSPPLFDELTVENVFYGVIRSEASEAAFGLTSYELVVLVETPIIVFPLDDIEIVNLAQLRPGEIDMTIIFRDFKEDNVFEINSIPIKSLVDIKDCLNYGSVKYYVNTKQLDWKAIVKDIVDSPEKFIENGGWDYFELEDYNTLAYYCNSQRRAIG